MARPKSIRRTLIEWAIVLFGLPLLFVGGAELYHPGMLRILITNEYQPTSDEILAQPHFQPFLIDPNDVTAEFRNIDVDSAVFRYVSGERNEARFWAEIDRRITGTAWKSSEPDGEFHRYQRVIPPVQSQLCWGVDEVRVRYDPETAQVSVGWVQADEYSSVGGLSECRENEFAERRAWPRLRGSE